MSGTRPMTKLEVALFDFAHGVENQLRREKHSAADPFRLGLFWRLNEARREGVDVSQPMADLKSSLEKIA